MQFRMAQKGDQRDSVLHFLSEDTLDLAMRFRIQLVRVDPTTILNEGGQVAGGNGSLLDTEFNDTFNLQTWEAWEWHAFRSSFGPVVTDFWNNRFELTPNRPWYKHSAGGPAIALKINCGLDIELVESIGQAHHRYFIIKPTREDYRSWVIQPQRIAMLTDRDLSPTTSRRPTRVRRGRRVDVSFFQTTVVHEFGHTLGLHHVRHGGNADDAYGVSLDEQSTVMGRGETTGAGAAQPWIDQLRRHLIRSPNEQPVRFRARVVKEQSASHMYID